MRPVAGIGIVGCGNISLAYFRLAPFFNGLEIRACADIVPAAAEARAAEFGVRAMSVDGLLKSDDIDVVVNLTVPKAHFDVSLAALSAGKHAYSEKPLALDYDDARRLVAEADRRGLKVGAAPDTFLGAGGQTARKLLDKGTIGEVVSGSALVMSHGMEHWHPNPGFFFKPGAGPVFDVGPYYVTMLISLLGPVRSVVAMAKKGFAERIVSSEPRRGERIKVTTPTTVNAILEFASGAQVSLAASWDVWRHGHGNPIELYGTRGTMFVPDPNFFSGRLSHCREREDLVEVDTTAGHFGAFNWPPAPAQPTRANYRMLGVADLVDAARRDREPRCSGRLAAHAVDVMELILLAARERRLVRLRSTVARPEPLTAAEARRYVRKVAAPKLEAARAA